MKRLLRKNVIIVTIGAILIMLGILSLVNADEINLSEILKSVPDLHQGIAFSFDSNKVDYVTSITVCSLLKEHINLDIGYNPKQKIVGLASVKLVEIGEWVKFPILKYAKIEPFVYVALDRLTGSNEIDYGVGAKILSLSF